MNKKAVVILSGGLDSSTCAYIAENDGYEVYPLTFLYGQRHDKEIESAKKISESIGAKERHRFITLPTPQMGSLTTDEEVPEERSIEEMSVKIPTTYVPARNTIFISFALQYAEEIQADAIYIGVTAMDFSGYPDCRPEYIEAWQNLIKTGTKRAVESNNPIKLEAPLLQLYKAEIIDWGLELGVPYELTWSCYKGGNKACGKCDSCKLRLKGFKEAGQEDPIEYEQR